MWNAVTTVMMFNVVTRLHGSKIWSNSGRFLASPMCQTVLRNCSSTAAANFNNNHLTRHLQARIKASGPISIAEYMKEVLTNLVSGYYMHRDVFGTEGDFITSPEISQMFGELLGVWCVNEWINAGSPNHVQVVELGPGRGTLADDMLRVFSKFHQIKSLVSLHLVEISPKLSEIQHRKLSNPTQNIQNEQLVTPSSDKEQETTETVCYRSCSSKYGVPVSWYKELSDVPRGFSIYIAHEFFDALPIYKFQHTSRGWSEVLIDYNDNNSELQYVLSPGSTIPTKSLLHVSPEETRDHIELCPVAGVITQQLSRRIATDGGLALIADYGHDGDKTDTFRAFKKHALHDPLKEPGSADLTADVDFSYLRKNAGTIVSTCGPITQQEFLFNMGIQYRLQTLLQKAPTDVRKDLISGFEMLTDPKKMGERFKFFALLNNNYKNYTPAGFLPP